MTLQQAETIFPDAELWATGRLRTLLAGRPESYLSGLVISNSTPSTRPARLVTFRRDGGVDDGLFDRPRFGVNVWGSTEADVANIARLVAAVLRHAPGDGVCVRMRMTSGPSPIPDAAPRRYMAFEATLRGTHLEV